MIVLLALTLSVRPVCQDDSKTWIAKNEVWVRTAAGPRQVTHDKIPKRLATLSPSGERLVYVVDDSSDIQQGQPPKEYVIELDANGEALQHITPKGYVPNAFERLEWINNQRVGAMTCGHANCMYWILNVDSGKTLQVMSGGFDFIWSHNRRWVARRFVAYLDASLGTDPDELDGLMLNEKWVYPPRDKVAKQGHQFGPFTWSPRDVWLGFTDTVSPEGDAYVVLASSNGAILRETVPVDVQPDAKVEWDDDTHLRLITSGHSFSFVVRGTELQEVTR